jgi:small GTP-binding protein
MDIKLIPESQISNTNDFTFFKIIIIGDNCVGKMEILKRAVKNSLDENYQAAIGFEFLLMHFIVNDLKIKLQIWDTCGQEMYRSLVQGFYRNTSLALIVYDISDKKTYDNLDNWIRDLRTHTDPELPIFIAGNKFDLENNRQVAYNDAKDYSLSSRTKYFTECSAKTGYNVENIFYEAAKYLYNACKELGRNKIPTNNKLKINKDVNNENNQIKKKKCC